MVEWLRATGIAELANAAGLFAALAGIGLTLLQLLLLRRQLKLDALIKVMDSNREIVALGFEHPAVWSVMEDDPATVLASEATAHRRYLQLWVNHMQVMWMAWKLGLVSGREWAAYRLDMAEFLRGQSLQEHWTKVSRFYPEGFRRLVSELSSSRERNGVANSE